MKSSDPRNRKSYVFGTEDKYYRQYAESYFGITTQKGGGIAFVTMKYWLIIAYQYFQT